LQLLVTLSKSILNCYILQFTQVTDVLVYKSLI